MENNESKVLIYNKIGLIPGPKETLQEYIRRADYCLNLRETLSQDHGEIIPSEVMEEQETPQLEEAWEITRPMYDIAPNWAPLFFSNHQLAPWHGGCAWIFHITMDAPMGALFQLRRTFKKNNSFLGLYKRPILLAHEAVHVARMAFEEPKFEEILAYRTSQSNFQKYVGPLPESSKETSLFMLAVFIAFVVDLAIGEVSNWPLWVLILNLLPIAMIAFSCIRLSLRHKQLDNCLEKLSAITDRPEAVACRLTDKEIIDFAKLSGPQILQYAKERADEPRWNVILKAYF